MTRIEFNLTLETTASCSDMTAGSPFAAAMKEVGAQLVGGVPLDAVSVACSAAARRLREARRLQQQALTMAYDVEVPTADAAASEAALSSATLADVQAIIATAVTNSGTSLAFTVDEASITAMKASVTSTAIAPAGGSSSTAAPGGGGGGSVTTDAPEASGAFEIAPKCIVVLYALLMVMTAVA